MDALALSWTVELRALVGFDALRQDRGEPHRALAGNMIGPGEDLI
jgi:hypothetical protein